MLQRSRWIACVVLAGGLLLAYLPRIYAGDADIRYVALGDSITAARYDDGGGFVPRYTTLLSTDVGAPVATANLGVGGWTSATLLDALRNDQMFRDDVAGGDVVTVFIGMNDFLQPTGHYRNGTCGGVDNQDCLRSSVAAFDENLHALLDEIDQLNTNPSLVLRLCDVYYPTAGNPTVDDSFAVLLPYLQEINESIHAEAGSRGLDVARVFAAFSGEDGTEDSHASGLLRDDGIHPSAAGFERIATLLQETGYAPLVEPIELGDANRDGPVDARDATLILQQAAGLVAELPGVGDANGDGVVDARDAALVLQLVAGLIQTLPG